MKEEDFYRYGYDKEYIPYWKVDEENELRKKELKWEKEEMTSESESSDNEDSEYDEIY